jgi:DNA-binding GntR family transcriptional regulator
MADPRLYVRVYEVLSARIDSGELPPGTRLNIGLLASEMFGGIARDTVAHALRLLEDAGQAERYPGLGWYVK